MGVKAATRSFAGADGRLGRAAPVFIVLRVGASRRRYSGAFLKRAERQAPGAGRGSVPSFESFLIKTLRLVEPT